MEKDAIFCPSRGIEQVAETISLLAETGKEWSVYSLGGDQGLDAGDFFAKAGGSFDFKSQIQT